MNENQNQSNQAEKQSDWSKTQYANLIRYVPSGTYYARLRVSGKLIRQSLKTDKITVAKMRLDDLTKAERQAATRQTDIGRGKLTVGDALQLTVDQAKGNPALKPRTRAYYDERADALKRSWPDLVKQDVRNVSKAHCLKWAAEFGANSSPIAFNHTVSLLKRSFATAIESGARFDNPADSIKWLKERPKQLQLPEANKFEALVREIENCGWVYGKDSANMVRFLAYGGCRKGEAVNVRWQDCNFETGKIIVRGDPETGTKGGEPRTVPMIPEMKRLLETVKEAKPDAAPDSPVIEFKDCRKALAHACDRVGIPRITHHDLRHLFATRCIESGVDIPTVSRWLGHKDGGALAMRVYGHLRDAHSVEMAKRVTFSAPAANIVEMPKRQEVV